MNLASKLMLALFPPHAPFFRLSVDDLVYKKIQGSPEQKQVIDSLLVFTNLFHTDSSLSALLRIN